MATVQTTIKINDQFSSALKNMNKALTTMVSGLTRADNKVKTAFSKSEIRSMNSAINKATADIGKMTNAQKNFNQQLTKSTSSANNLWGKLKSIAGAYAGWQTVKSAVGASDTYANNTARLGLLTSGGAETAALQQKIYEASQRSLTNYNAMTDAVAKLGITAKQAFNSNDEIVRFTELLNKQFKVAGTGAQEQAAAMYQLTQAMAAGKLQGDEFRSILENAPMLAQSIAKEMGVLPGQLKEMSSQGLITAQVIKNALFKTAGDVDEMYRQLPMTFGGMWTQVVNKINKGLEGLWQKLGALWSSDKFQRFVNALVDGFVWLGHVVAGLMDVFATVFGFISQYWNSIIEPILIAAAFTYIPIMIAKLWAMVPPLVASAAAWLAINWPILVVIAAIAAVIAIVRYMGWTFGDVVGAVAGAFRWLGALIGNIFKGIANIALGCGQWIVQRFKWVGDTLGVIFSNIGVFWNNLWQNAKIAFYSFLDAVLSGLEFLAKPLIKLTDLFGLDLGGAFDNLHAGLNGKIASAEAHKQKYGKLPEWNPDVNWKTFDYSNLGDAYNAGKKWGSNAVSKLGDYGKLKSVQLPNGAMMSVPTSTGSIGNAMKNANAPLLDALDNIDKNTAATASSVSMNNEDMTYLRDLAERQAINNISNRTIKVEMTNNNSIASNMDLDNVVDYIGEKIHNLAIMSADGTHY